MNVVGQSVRRREDGRFLTGRGRYVADLARPHLAFAVIVRSPHAHAVIRRIDTRRATTLPGVLDCITFADLPQPVVPIPLRRGFRPALQPYLQRPLAEDRARYVGEPVAVVVARDRYLAEDARELVEVEYELLPAVVDAERALVPGSPPLYPEGNVADAWTLNIGDVAGAFADAAHVLRRRFAIQRQTGVPMETRGLIAEYDAGRGVITVWGPTKIPYFNRQILASMLAIDEDRIHFIEPDVGGSFGTRGEFYPEDFLIPFLAMRLGRPVGWIEDRREHFMSVTHSREQYWELALALDRNGWFLAVDATLVSDMGAFLHVTTVPTLAAAYLPGPYRLPNYRCRVSCVMTNKAPNATLRGPGVYESNFVRERAIDLAATELQMDPAELRLRNLIPPAEMPYKVGTDKYGMPTVYDTGDFPSVFRRALERFGYRELLDSSQRETADPDVRVGVGLACLVEPSGWGPLESAKVQVTPAGNVQVLTGATSQGQGQETTLAQVCADVLRVPLEAITVRHGDTALMPYGQGTHASRSAVMAGSAVHFASVKLKERIIRAAADRLEVSSADLRLEAGRVFVVGMPARGYSLKELAALVASPRRRATDGEPPVTPEVDPLEALHYHTTTHDTSAFAVHFAVVAVDVRSGVVQPRRYAVVCDVGRAINPMIVEGQLIGGVIQGLGGALLEELVYDDAGQLLTTSLMDYLLPSAAECPAVEVTLLEEAPSPSNPLGVKGVGELGTSGAGAAFANAVANALGPGVEITRLPLSPDRLHTLLRREP